MSSTYRNQLESWLKTIKVDGGSVLDVGGLEKPIQGRVEAYGATRTAILDTEGGDYVYDLNKPSNPAELFSFEGRQTWDTIFCLEVFEYIWNPIVAMRNLWSWLPEGGKLYVTFPTNYPLHNPPGIDYMRYTENWIRKVMVEYFKFKSVDITPRVIENGQEAIGAFWSLERMHPIKHDERLYHTGYLVESIK